MMGMMQLRFGFWKLPWANRSARTAPRLELSTTPKGAHGTHLQQLLSPPFTLTVC